ncbi:MAG TPA: hypothetical protein VH309_14355, partial [Elusimicrobiota bacterium]|nr:hypothetical protein [Elusimicrobiota bacterium]
ENEALAPAAILVRTPGAAATGVAAEAAAYSGGEEYSSAAPLSAASPAARKGLVGRLTDVVLGRASVSALFDASVARGEKPAPVFARMGLQEHKPILLPNGSRPDEQPTTPSPDREPTVVLQSYALPGGRDVGGVLETNRKVLAADPNDVASVVAAIKGMVDADRARFGVSSSELRLIGARKFEGHGDQADAIFVHFRQLKDGLVVNGANLSFTLKVIGGRPMVVAQTGQLFPQIDVNVESTLTEDQVMSRIAERVGMPVADAASAFEFSEEKIIYSRGSWRHVKLYVAEGLPFMIAVDMSNGLVFAWDNRTGLKTSHGTARKAKDAGPNGTIAGKAVDHGPILPTAQLKDIPLAFLNLTIGGKTYTTDRNGKFSAAGLELPAAGLTLAATLSGPFVNVQDTSGKTLTINVTLKPGEGAISAVFNPDSTLNDENAISQVSAFHKVNLAYDFLRVRKLTTEQMDKNPIIVRTNIDDECNAYYTPGSPSLNFFKSSANCVNSAYDTVADHEYGHYWDDSTGGIMNGGLSEGWGDTVSMYLLNNPVIGEHFLKHPGPDGKDYIREGNNTYQYNEYDEVHDQGQAWQGFTWKLRKALIKKLGYDAGSALAEAMVLPTMFAKAATIPDAMAQVLVNAMKKDGTIQYEALIRATAKIHGIVLPQNPGKGFVAGMVRWTMEALALSPRARYFEAEKSGNPAGNAAATSVGARLTLRAPGDPIRVGDNVLNPINGTAYAGKVKKLYSDGTALIGYGFLTDLNDSYAPVSNLIKQVDRFGDWRVGDKVLNPINGLTYAGKVKKLYSDGTALIGYGFLTDLSDSYRNVANLIKQK